MLRLISHETGSCYQRCVGFDAMNALYMTTYEIDESTGRSTSRGSQNFSKRSSPKTSWWWAA